MVRKFRKNVQKHRKPKINKKNAFRSYFNFISNPIFSCLPVVRSKIPIRVRLSRCWRHVINAYGSTVFFIEISANVRTTGLYWVGSFSCCFWFKMLDFHFHDVMSPVSVHVYNSFGLLKSNCWPMIVCPSMPSSDRIHSPVIELNTRTFSSQITNKALKSNPIFF